jgi:hypothetical protein
MKKLHLSLVAAALAVALAITAFVVPNARAQTTGTSDVSVVHAVPGLTVDVYVNGDLLLPNFEPRTVTPFLQLPEGTYDIVIVPAGGDPSAPAIAGSVDVPSGENISLVAHLAADGTPTLSAFINDVDSMLAHNKSRVVVRHVAAAPEVDVELRQVRRVNGGWVIGEFTNVPNGAEGQIDVPRRFHYSLTINAAGTDESVLGPRRIFARGNDLFAYYVMGSLSDGTLQILRQRVNVP